MHHHHNHYLIALSILIAIFASYTSLDLVNSLSTSKDQTADHIQEFSYYVSKTSLKFANVIEILPSLSSLEIDTDHIKLVRLVFLNRWFDETNGRGVTYIEDFIKELKNKCFSLINHKAN